jgi:integrase
MEANPYAIERAPDELATYLSRARAFAGQAKSENTRRAYQGDWRDFEEFCRATHRSCLPASPETVVAYAADLASRVKARTVERRLASISQAHQMAGIEPPTRDSLVRTVMAGIRRVKGTAQSSKKPLTPEIVRLMVGSLAGDLAGLRDKAMILIGFAGGFRRSELVALQIADIEWTEQGIIVTVARSKTDPMGEGQRVGVPRGKFEETCPVHTLSLWVEASGIRNGPLFRRVDRWSRRVGDKALSGHQVARIIKNLAGQVGLDETLFSGHSLRSGLATSAAERGASERAIMDQTRHRSVQQVRRYIKRGQIFQDNAAHFLEL